MNNDHLIDELKDLAVLHKFRSEILSMANVNERLLVFTKNGAYVSDKNLKRWKKVKPKL